MLPPRVAFLLDPLLLPGPEFAVGTELRLEGRLTLLFTTSYGARPLIVPKGRPSSSTASGFLMVEPRLILFKRGFDDGPHLGWTFAFARALGGPVEGLFEPPLGLSTGPMVGWSISFRPLGVPLFIDSEMGPLLTIANPAHGTDSSHFHFLGRMSLGVAF